MEVWLFELALVVAYVLIGLGMIEAGREAGIISRETSFLTVCHCLIVIVIWPIIATVKTGYKLGRW